MNRVPRPLCLDHLSLPELTAAELIEVAARLGFAAVSPFFLPLPLGPYRDLLRDEPARREVKNALRETGLSVGIVEPFMLGERIDWDEMARGAALAAELGGTVNALCFDPEPERQRASFVRLADIARTAGAAMAVEAFTLSVVRTQAEALALADLAGNVGLVVDTLHVMRTGGSWADVAALPPARIVHVQINDGPREPPADLAHEAIAARMPPGQGQFDLAALIPLLPPGARLAVEAPFAAPGADAPERGAMLMAAARALLD